MLSPPLLPYQIAPGRFEYMLSIANVSRLTPTHVLHRTGTPLIGGVDRHGRKPSAGTTGLEGDRQVYFSGHSITRGRGSGTGASLFAGSSLSSPECRLSREVRLGRTLVLIRTSLLYHCCPPLDCLERHVWVKIWCAYVLHHRMDSS
jgi:hypothetical protein